MRYIFFRTDISSNTGNLVTIVVVYGLGDEPKIYIYARVRIDVTPSSAVWICLHFHGPLSPNPNLLTANITIESPPSQQSTSIIKAIIKREVKVRDGLIEGGYSTNLSAMNRFGK